MKDFDTCWEELELLKNAIRVKRNYSQEQVCLDALMMMMLTTEEVKLKGDEK